MKATENCFTNRRGCILGKAARTLFGALALSPLIGLQNVASAVDTGALVYYGDRNNNRVFALDPRSPDLENSIRTVIPTVGAGSYPVDGVSGGRVYVSTRSTQSVDIIKNGSADNGFMPSWVGVIALQHTPRSVTFNKTRNLAAVSGANRVMTSIIDTITDTVVGVVGNTTLVSQTRDYGGTTATGHPFWVDADRFLMLDRINRRVSMYRIDSTNRIHHESTISTPSSVHHFISVADVDGLKLYASSEGSPANGIRPAALEVKFVLHHAATATHPAEYKLVLGKVAYLTGFPANTMGSHHIDLCPNGDHIFMGSTEGHLFTVNRHTMQIAEVINAGKGAGHTIFNMDRGLAVVVNHTDTFLTVLRATMMTPGTAHTHPSIATVPDVSPPQVTAGQNTLSHTSSFDPGTGGRFFYSMASDNGSFFRVDMDTYTVHDRVMLSPGGYPIQGTFVWPTGSAPPM